MDIKGTIGLAWFAIIFLGGLVVFLILVPLALLWAAATIMGTPFVISFKTWLAMTIVFFSCILPRIRVTRKGEGR